jgi:O-antigen/teichoic acid export membrane protein
MFKKIAGTIATRVLVAVMALLTWIFNARLLGPEHVGTLGLIIFSVAIIQIMTSFIGGAGLVYFTARTGVYRLFIPSLIWSVVISVASAGLMMMLGRWYPVIALIPEGYFIHVLVLSLLISVTTMNLNLMLGLEKIRYFNTIGLLQASTAFLLLIVSLFLLKMRDVMAYYLPLVTSYLLSTGLSLAGIWPHLEKTSLKDMKTLVGGLLRFGSWVQFANIFQTLNYRLSLKFIDFFTGRTAAGILTIGLQISEGVWLIGRSVAMVQYSRLSNTEDSGYSSRLTLTLAKITWVITAFAMGLLLLIPESFFIMVFTAKFHGIKMLILSLSAGVVMLSMSMIFSGFFSATNKPYHNTIASAAGLVLTVGLGLVLVPLYGLIGAGLAATASYSVTTIYQFIVFSKMTRLTIRDFLLTRRDLSMLVSEGKKLLRKPGE